MSKQFHCIVLLIIAVSQTQLANFCSADFAPKPAYPFEELWRWQLVRPMDSRNALELTQANDGSMWAGLTEGIARFDGFEWSYVHEQANIPAQRSHVFSASNGDIYVRSIDYIHRYANDEWQMLVKHQRIHARKSVMREALDGSIWSLEDKGISHIKGDAVEFYRLNDLEFDDMYIDGKHLWLVEHLKGDLYRYHIDDQGLDESSEARFHYPIKFHHYFKSQTFSLAASHGCIWHAGMHHGSGFWCYEPDTDNWREIDLSHTGGSRTHFGLNTDQHNNLWVWGPYFISIFNGDDWQSISAKDYPIPRPAYEIIHSRDGSTWVYGNYSPIWRIANHAKQWQRSYHDLIFQQEYPKGVEWFISPKGGVAIHNKNEQRWLHFDTKNMLMDVPITLKISQSGHVWVGGVQHEGDKKIAATANATVNSILSLSDENSKAFSWKRHIHHDLGLRVASGQLHVDEDGVALVVADIPYEGGMVEILPSGTTRRFFPPYVPKRVTYVNVDKQDNIWFTTGLDLHRIARDKLGIENYQDYSDAPKALGLSNINRIIVAPSGDIWISTRLHGVFRRQENGVWQHFDKTHGLNSPVIRDLSINKEGDIFCVTHDEVLRFDGLSWSNSFSSILPFRVATISIQHAFNDGVWFNLNLRNIDNLEKVKLRRSLDTPHFFGAFKTLHYLYDRTAPDTQINAYNERVQGGDYNIVQWSGSDQWQTKNEQLLSFSYQVDQQPWSAFSVKSNHVFENLGAGHHTIRVRARDADFNIDPSPAEIQFEVIPPLLEQRWFQVSLFAVICISFAYLFSFFKLREIHNQRLERLRMSFFTNVSHELRTPLTLILGPVELLLKEKLSATQQNSINIIKRNAERLTSLLDELLDFRKLDEGALRINNSNGDIIQFSQELLESFKVIAETKKINIEHLFSSEQMTLEFDKDIYEKIFNNLLSNAIKYTPQNGKIFVKIELEAIPGKNSTNIFSLTVEDTGVGITSEEIPHVFDKFFRSKHIGQAAQGSGIGLALCKELVEFVGGSINVESPIDLEAKRGTRFRCTLPLKTASVREQKAEQKDEQIKNSGSTSLEIKKVFLNDKHVVLVVEDDSDIVALIQQCLGEEYTIVHAENGYEGLQQLEQKLPDLIITDVMMPVMDGVDFCQKVKSNESTSHIPIIMLSARGNESAELKGLETGADDYIRKPFKLSLLKSRVKNLITSRQILLDKYLATGALQEAEPKATSNADFQERAIRVIYQHLNDSDFGAKEFASEMNMSYQNLYVKIKALTGQAPQNFISSIRLERAMQMIKSSPQKHNIVELAALVGFEDSNYFSRRFKQKFGVSPSKVKKTN